MTDLWRCDVCGSVFEVASDVERTDLHVGIDKTGLATIDLCPDCRPSSTEAHVEWMTAAMEEGSA